VPVKPGRTRARLTAKSRRVRSNDRLVDAIWDVIEFIIEHSGSAQARHRALRTAGHSVWLVPVQGLFDDQAWVILWQPRGDDALIVYIGPGDFRPGRV
jgi:hypothetical protein